MFKLSVGQLLYMKRKNKKPTEIYCVEDLFKYYLFGQALPSCLLIFFDFA